MHRTPVGYNCAVPSPFPFEDIVHQDRVVARMFSTEKIVSTHERPCAGIRGSLEGGEIYFVESAVIHNGVGCMAVYFVVVEGEMLYTHSDSVTLDTIHIRYCHLRCEIRVLTHIFEVPAVEGRTVDVNTRTEQNAFIAEACLFTDAFAVKERHIGVPCGGESGQRGESCAGIVGPLSLFPFVPENFRTHSHRSVGTPYFRDSESWNARRGEFRLGVENLHFLFESHTRKGILHALFNWFGIIEIYRNSSRSRQ